MHEEWKNMGLVEDKVIEEASEVIQAICKIKRFGMYNYHPDKPNETNINRLLDEINDLEEILKEYKEELKGE